MRRKFSIDTSPPPARWMKDVLDRSVFHRTITVLAAQLPAAKTGAVLKAETMRGFIINVPKIRSIVSDSEYPGGDNKLVLLRVQNEADLSTDAQSYLKSQNACFTTHNIELKYDYWTADEILHAILPEELLDGSPTGFSVTGHLAHINLNDEYLPYKYIIGQVILDKNKRLRTVVNKLDSIDTQFRFFQMELLAGEPNYVVEHSESDCCFKFDFSRVYWNSRLHTEHARLVDMFRPDELVADVFAGVGPFALPAAKKGCAVLANDLNPDSYKYLSINIKDNKVSDRVRASCEDGREFIRHAALRVAADPLPGYAGPPLTQSQRRTQSRHRSCEPIRSAPPPPRKRIAHFVMNLPDSAITFLDAFSGIFASSSSESDIDLQTLYDVMPMVHCHCFTRELEREAAERDIRHRVEEQLGCVLGAEDEVSVHLVRSVAPNKDMYCISFRLPRATATAC
ncbi:Met-10+ like-protein-domain-containing protein [Multifurca ochricompacta]|uniref:tRNA (guanine(37)-N1)-methyltransferase n=1 Tax=Multifurca ochricompacta TaxID=376703 RepID=A0AAD4MDA8_9AGAM|nr:Met-10+ like-protein-domain-containing protein [Multifurca ochricompacta]